MSDELVKRANEAVAALAVYGSDDDQKVADLLFNLRVRIEALTAERGEAESREAIAADTAVKYLERAEKAEAKLATLVKAARPFAQIVIRNGLPRPGEIGRTDVTNIRAALAYIEGEKP